MELVDRRTYYNRCFPGEPLEPDDDRNVDFDFLGERSGLPVRGINWTEKIVEEIVLSDRPVCKLFTGLSGAGKTTELKRLADRLSDPESADLFPVFLDAEDVLDLSEPACLYDLLLCMVRETEKAILGKEKEAEGEASEPLLSRQLWDWLNKRDAKLSDSRFVVSRPENLVLEMRARPELRSRVLETLTANCGKFEKHCKRAFRSLADKAGAKFGKSGVVVVFDSLDKMRGVAGARDAALDASEKCFAFRNLLKDLPVHAIFAVSPALATRIDHIDFLPLLKVRDRDGSSYEPGVYAARELILRRTPESALEEIFGININTRIDRIGMYSGGNPKEMVSMLRMCIAQKKHPLADSEFEHILFQTANRYRGLVAPADAPWLAQVAAEKFLAIKDEENRRKIEYALGNNIVLRYLNDALWYDLHPAVLDNPVVQKALKATARSAA